jgi:hypothetical protein
MAYTVDDVLEFLKWKRQQSSRLTISKENNIIKRAQNVTEPLDNKALDSVFSDDHLLGQFRNFCLSRIKT